MSDESDVSESISSQTILSVLAPEYGFSLVVEYEGLFFFVPGLVLVQLLMTARAADVAIVVAMRLRLVIWHVFFSIGVTEMLASCWLNR